MPMLRNDQQQAEAAARAMALSYARREQQLHARRLAAAQRLQLAQQAAFLNPNPHELHKQHQLMLQQQMMQQQMLLMQQQQSQVAQQLMQQQAQQLMQPGVSARRSLAPSS
jgi:hypothetical protein